VPKHGVRVHRTVYGAGLSSAHVEKRRVVNRPIWTLGFTLSKRLDVLVLHAPSPSSRNGLYETPCSLIEVQMYITALFGWGLLYTFQCAAWALRSGFSD